ncbi:hypothetical protein ACKWTF_015996 [Chironomus riparius]
MHIARTCRMPKKEVDIHSIGQCRESYLSVANYYENCPINVHIDINVYFSIYKCYGSLIVQFMGMTMGTRVNGNWIFSSYQFVIGQSLMLFYCVAEDVEKLKINFFFV